MFYVIRKRRVHHYNWESNLVIATEWLNVTDTHIWSGGLSHMVRASAQYIDPGMKCITVELL